MRRFIVAMLVVASALSTPLVGQRAVSLGYATTVGTGWQLEGVDVGYTFGLRAVLFRSVTVGTRLGLFSEHGQPNGAGSRGFVGAAVLQARSGRMRLADVGSETNPGIIGLDMTVEAIAYGSANSPLPVGSPWGALSFLPGVRFGKNEGARYGVVAGPTWYFGDASSVHAFVGFRVDLPVSSGRPSH